MRRAAASTPGSLSRCRIRRLRAYTEAPDNRWREPGPDPLRLSMMKTALIVLALIAVAVGAAVAWRHWQRVERQDPNALWNIVHDLCTRDQIANHLPAPCLEVDLSAGYAVLKDRVRGVEVMVIPTARVTGIEDAAVRGATAPNYWQDAWRSRRYVEQFARRPIPRDDVGMAINSVAGRSQNQLHIHVYCLRPDVKQALVSNLSRIGPTWSRFRLDLPGGRYRAMWLPGADLVGRNPFALLADGDPTARAAMDRETMVVAPATRPDGAPGFVLLASGADQASPGEGHGESLLDQNCAVLHGAD